MEISKADWKLFRERVSGWQEHYMEQLAKEYVKLVPVIWNLLDANMGSVLLMEGNFTRHSL